ncbi:hypothetical protein ZIOFF_075648 [Zingiber officinale]|uniref:Uncharacterized protein n=1 Tax=Zingiber officinale TaxID=94328 RepID=A0A8J5CQ14_ZINOF|nr:hypothetical protein ZIOFF_075648 [Zingiber officinale]
MNPSELRHHPRAPATGTGGLKKLMQFRIGPNQTAHLLAMLFKGETALLFPLQPLSAPYMILSKLRLPSRAPAISSKWHKTDLVRFKTESVEKSGHESLSILDFHQPSSQISLNLHLPMPIGSPASPRSSGHRQKWWFMPVNLGIVFLFGGILGWIVVKLLKPQEHLEGLVVATCSSGNLGNLMLIIIPAACLEKGNPFSDETMCSARALSYVSFSMAEIPLLLSGGFHDKGMNLGNKLKEALQNFVEELLAPPTVASIIGLIVGAVPWLKPLFIGLTAPLKVVQDSIRILGDGTVPCITLILGRNLTQGICKSTIKPMVIFAIVCVRYMIFPLIGIAVVQAAYEKNLSLNLNAARMNQLFDVGQEESSVIFLWTYLIAAIALTFWSTVFIWLLS